MRKLHFLWVAALLGQVPVIGAESKAQTPKPDFKSFKEAYAAGNQALKDHRFQEAVADYRAAESLSPTPKSKSQAENAQGWASLKSRKWEEAKVEFQKAVEADDQNKVALKNLGVANFRLYEYGFAGVEELKEAIKHLEESGENEEQLERAKGALAREEAYAQATPVAEVNSSEMSYKSLQALGDKLQLQGQFDEALKAFRRAELNAPSPKGKGTAANRQGKALLDARRPQDSVAHFERAVKLVPDEKVFLNNLGYSYWALYDSGRGTLEDLKRSVDAYYKANAIDPSFHAEMMRMALDELRDVDPEGAKAYSVKDDSTPDGEDSAKNGDDSK